MADKLDKYIPLRLLSSKFNSVTYLVQRKTDNTKVVIKKIELHPLLLNYPNHDVFQQLKKIMKIKHPYVLQIYTYFVIQNFVYIVEEYANGEDLRDKIRKSFFYKKIITEKQVVKWSMQIATALHYLHHRNIYHLQLKPSNVFFTKSPDSLKIGDFGILREFSHPILKIPANFLSPIKKLQPSEQTVFPQSSPMHEGSDFEDPSFLNSQINLDSPCPQAKNGEIGKIDSDQNMCSEVYGEFEVTNCELMFPEPPFYKSPEELLMNRLSAKTDMWGLGIIMHELCGIHKAYDGNDDSLVISNILTNTIVPLSKNYSEALMGVISSLLLTDPDSRLSLNEYLERMQNVEKSVGKLFQEPTGRIEISRLFPYTYSIVNLIPPDILELMVYLGSYRSEIISFESNPSLEYRICREITEEGKYYEGEWNKTTLKMEGYGLLVVIKTGSVFEGIFSKQSKPVEGRLIYSNCTYYEGQWLNGKRHGKGKFVDSNAAFTGEFRDNIRNGQFTVNYFNGDVYEGEFHQDLKNGLGTFYETNKNQKYEGSFQDGKKHGHGKFFYQNGSIYNGHWDQNLRQGQGTLKMSDGTQYEGIWKNDKLQGEVKIIHKNMEVDVVTWVEGMPEPS